jgi:transcriptional antiterminator
LKPVPECHSISFFSHTKTIKPNSAVEKEEKCFLTTPIVEKLVPNDTFNVVKVNVRGSAIIGQNISGKKKTTKIKKTNKNEDLERLLGIEDIEAFVLHGTKVEIGN